jgi:hypothetical protein
MYHRAIGTLVPTKHNLKLSHAFLTFNRLLKVELSTFNELLEVELSTFNKLLKKLSTFNRPRDHSEGCRQVIFIMVEQVK